MLSLSDTSELSNDLAVLVTEALSGGGHGGRSFRLVTAGMALPTARTACHAFGQSTSLVIRASAPALNAWLASRSVAT